MPSLIPGILTHIYVSRGRIWLGCRSWRCCKEGSSVFRYWFCVQCSRRPDFDIKFQAFEGLKDPNGGRRLRSQVCRDLDCIAAQIKLAAAEKAKKVADVVISISYVLKKKMPFIGIHDTDLPVMICRYGLYICSSVLHFWLTRDPSGRVKSAPAKEVYLRALDLICQWLGFYLHSIGDFTHHWVKSPLEANKILGKFYLILLEILLG